MVLEEKAGAGAGGLRFIICYVHVPFHPNCAWIPHFRTIHFTIPRE